MVQKFIKIKYVNGKEEKFVLDENNVVKFNLNPITIYFKKKDEEWRKIIYKYNILSVETNYESNVQEDATLVDVTPTTLY